MAYFQFISNFFYALSNLLFTKTSLLCSCNCSQALYMIGQVRKVLSQAEKKNIEYVKS